MTFRKRFGAPVALLPASDLAVVHPIHRVSVVEPIRRASLLVEKRQEELARAMGAIIALSTMFGDLQPVVQEQKKQAIKAPPPPPHENSVAAWAEENKAKFYSPRKSMLARLVMESPHFNDPSSVFELSASMELFDSLVVYNPFKAVHFDNDPVSNIVEIPSHRDMDRNMVEQIWSSCEEIHKNGQRNALEYWSDGRDWRKVKEEDEMIYDAATDSLYHPATWEEMQEEEEMKRWGMEQAERRRAYTREQALAQQEEALAQQQAILAEEEDKEECEPMERRQAMAGQALKDQVKRGRTKRAKKSALVQLAFQEAEERAAKVNEKKCKHSGRKKKSPTRGLERGPSRKRLPTRGLERGPSQSQLPARGLERGPSQKRLPTRGLERGCSLTRFADT